MLNKSFENPRDTSAVREARKPRKRPTWLNMLCVASILVLIGFGLFAYRMWAFLEGWD